MFLTVLLLFFSDFGRIYDITSIPGGTQDKIWSAWNQPGLTVGKADTLPDVLLLQPHPTTTSGNFEFESESSFLNSRFYIGKLSRLDVSFIFLFAPFKAQLKDMCVF